MQILTHKQNLGQLGLGHKIDQLVPQRVPTFTTDDILLPNPIHIQQPPQIPIQPTLIPFPVI